MPRRKGFRFAITLMAISDIDIEHMQFIVNRHSLTLCIPQ
ncbi:Uncharacterised protein [Vibrio cholerae]|nr:Uncharacterised protein [Vibrio cholerae]